MMSSGNAARQSSTECHANNTHGGDSRVTVAIIALMRVLQGQPKHSDVTVQNLGEQSASC